MKISMEQLVSFAKQQGFIYQGSEIYGGLANAWDYGQLGVELKNNIKKAWWKKFIQESVYNIGLDSSILMNPQVWVASGHIGNFTDPLIDCKKCNARHRADKLIEEAKKIDCGGWSNEKMLAYLYAEKIVCPVCKGLEYTEIRKFNMMFKTNQGVIEDEKNTVYLRPETAQGIFVNFKNVQRTSRKKIPFGIGQIGKSFRNEITPGNFIFRTREFEQMELEFFCKPHTEIEWFDYWKNYCHKFLLYMGINETDIRIRDHSKEELSHYSNATSDFEFRFPWGFGELWGIASRTDFDLKSHQNLSGQNLEYIDPEDNSRYIPYVIEPSLGVERLLLSIMFSAYDKEELQNGEIREVLRLEKFLAPYKAAILPLIKKNHQEKALSIFQEISKQFMATYDDAGNIGKRYRRNDAIGTPYCITIDDETINNNTVTIRDRDTMIQEIIKVDDIINYLDLRVRF